MNSLKIETICGFKTKETEFLSNMYETIMLYDNNLFNSSEAAYQYAKCALDEDKEKFLMYKNLSPYECKSLGKSIKKRYDWDNIKLGVMFDIVFIKFHDNLDLMRKLVKTGRSILIEDNFWKDRFWGIYQGRGENWLGQILMDVRTICQLELSNDFLGKDRLINSIYTEMYNRYHNIERCM